MAGLEVCVGSETVVFSETEVCRQGKRWRRSEAAEEDGSHE